MDAITFTVYGRPQQRGSKIATTIPKKGGGWVTSGSGRPVVVARDANVNSKEWMGSVAKTAHDAYAGELLQGPIHLVVEFFFKHPKKHFRTGKHAGVLRDDAPKYHDQTPDLDKLLRCLGDALTGVIWYDDRQVCVTFAKKLWTAESERAEVVITPWTNKSVWAYGWLQGG